MNETSTTSNPQVKVGDIFEMSWGYDQTNVNWFQVTRLSPKGVYVREISGRGVEGTQGSMCENVVAVKDSFLSQSQWTGEGNPEMFRKIKNGYKGTPSFSIKSRYFATLWDGKPTYNSWYA